MKKLLILVVLFLISLTCFGCIGKKEIQYTQIKADTMIDDYIRDQGTAEAKYKGINVELTGNMIKKGQFNNGNSFYVVIAKKYATGRSYEIVVEYPTDRVEDINKLKKNDFVVAKGMVVGIVPQKNPTDISVQMRVGVVSDGEKQPEATKTSTVNNPVNNVTTPVATPNVGNNAKFYYDNLNSIEIRMKQFADRINSGGAKSPLIATGNVLRDDIIELQRKVNDEPNADLRNQVNRMHELQIRRTNCMLRGLRGDTAAFAEGGGYYDEFYAKYNKFKADNNL